MSKAERGENPEKEPAKLSELLGDLWKYVKIANPIASVITHRRRERVSNSLTPGQQWQKFYGELLTPEDIAKIDSGELSTPEIQSLIKARKREASVTPPFSKN